MASNYKKHEDQYIYVNSKEFKYLSTKFPVSGKEGKKIQVANTGGKNGENPDS